MATLIIVSLLVILVWAAWETGSQLSPVQLWTGLQAFSQYFAAMFLTAGFVVFFVAILVLERICPADRSQAIISRGLLFDVALMIPGLLTAFLVVTPATVLYVQFLERHLPSPAALVGAWPEWLRIALVFLVLDLGSWLSHLVRHKVPLLWELHAVHHSQTEMNLMTEFRLHPLDIVFSAAIKSVVLFVLLIPAPQAVFIAVLEKYYLMFLHANVDISYGPLDRVFVSPRVHRIHHSALREHHDRNFGAYFSIWDTVFGTLYRGVVKPTRTGVDGIPDEHGGRWRDLPRIYLDSMVRPFRRRVPTIR